MTPNIRTCRICFDTKCEKRITFNTTDDEWINLFEFCVGIKPESDSNAPRVLCRSCADKLRDFAQFKTRCLKSHVIWSQTSINKSIQNPTKEKDDEYMEVEYLSNSFFDDAISASAEDNNSNTIDYNGDKIVIKPNISKPRGLETTPTGVKRSTRTRKAPKRDPVTLETKKPHYPRSARKKIGKMAAVDYNESLNAIVRSYIDKITPETIDKIKDDPIFKTPRRSAPVKRKTNKDTELQVQRVKHDEEFALNEDDEILDKEVKTNKKDPDYDPGDDDDSCQPVTSMFGIDIKRVMDAPVYDYHTSGIEDIVLDRENLPKAPFYYCGICEYKSVNEPDVRTHWDKHVTKNELNCRQCDYIGRDFAEMATHRYKHHPPEYEYKVLCPICPREFTCGRIHMLLEFHYREYHLHKKPGWCRVCGKQMDTFKMWRSHLAGHVNPYKCGHCGQIYTSRLGLKQHLETIGGIVHSCKTCGRTFSRLNYLKNHNRVYNHTPVTEVVFKTPHFEMRKITEVHNMSVHATTELKCEHCDLTFATPGKLNYHLQTHKGKTCICDICGAAFYTTYDLRTHQVFHSDERPYTCDLCGRKYKTKCILMAHIRNHMGLKPHMCSKCGKCFALRRTLRRHEIVHSGIRSVKCIDTQCDRTFYDKSAMMRHCKSKHK